MNDGKSWNIMNRLENMAPQSDIMMLVWRYRWLMACVMGVSLLVALVYLKRALPSYTATSRIYVQQDGPKIVNEFQGIVTQPMDNFLYTQCEVLRSTAIIKLALKKEGIEQLPMLAGLANPIGRIKGPLSAKVGSKDDIINVSFDGPNGLDAVKIVNAVVSAYIEYNSLQRHSTAAEVLKILQEEKTVRDKELTDKMEAMLQFRRQNGVYTLASDNTSPISQRLVTLTQALTDAQLQGVDAMAAFATAKAMLDNPVLVAEGQNGLILGGIEDTQLSGDLLRAQQRVLAMRKRYSDEHPLLQDARSQFDFLKKQYLAVVQQRLDKVAKKSGELQSLLDAQKELAKKSGVLSTKYALLEADVKRSERLCDILDNRIKEIDITESGGALNINVLEPARPEDVSGNSFRRFRILVLSLVLGAAISIGMAMGHDKLDQRMRSADEIATVTKAPVLGVVPSVPGQLSRAAQGQIVHIDPMSGAAEAYRSVRTAIYFGVTEEKNNRILVTSPIYGEGKTTVASNLSIAMAQSGQHTLLIDADFRKPTQQTIFQVRGEEGLSSVLAGDAPLRDAIYETTHKNLDVLPCGLIPPNPSEMLNSMAFLRVLDELSEQYDRVIIDSPPVIPVADARILGAMCNTSLLVVRAERSTRSATSKACDELRGVGTSIFGVVVNGVAKGGNMFGYFHDYTYPPNDARETFSAEA